MRVMGRGQYNGQEVYCGLSTASEVVLVFTTQLHCIPIFSMYFPFCTI